MTALHVWSIAAALISAATPWFVVRVALAVSSAHARDVAAPFAPPPSVSRLGWLTAIACAVAAVPALLLDPPSLLSGGIALACFLLMSMLGLRALGDVSEASRPSREVEATTRTASLRPRRLSDYVPLAWRLAPLTLTTASLALFVWRLTLPQPNRQLVGPVVFALAAPVFLWLYEVWMRGEVSGGSVAASHDPGRLKKVRFIFAAEVALVLCLSAAGHALLDLDWSAPAPQSSWAGLVTFAAAAVGILGCALAVSSELARQRYTRSTQQERRL